MFSPLALVKQTPGSHQASTHNSCPFQNRTACNLQSTRRSGTGLRDSSDANWLLVKDHPGGKQRALEILMPLTTLEECPLQKPLLCDSYLVVYYCCFFHISYKTLPLSCTAMPKRAWACESQCICDGLLTALADQHMPCQGTNCPLQ